jgi:hypothetical protein
MKGQWFIVLYHRFFVELALSLIEIARQRLSN